MAGEALLLDLPGLGPGFRADPASFLPAAPRLSSGRGRPSLLLVLCSPRDDAASAASAVTATFKDSAAAEPPGLAPPCYVLRDDSVARLFYRAKGRVDELALARVSVLTGGHRAALLGAYAAEMFTPVYDVEVAATGPGVPSVPSEPSPAELAAVRADVEACFRGLPAIMGPVRVLRSPLIPEERFLHGFSTRQGGVSHLPGMSSLNLSRSVRRRDPPGATVENKRRLAQAAGFALDSLRTPKARRHARPTHGPHTAHTRAPHGPHTDPTHRPTRPTHGPHTDPTQTHTDPTQTPHTDPTRAPHGPHTDPTRAPHTDPHRPHTDPTHRPHTGPTRTTHRPHTDLTQTHTGPTRTTHRPHTGPTRTTHGPHTGPTQTPHRPHTDPTQTPHRSHTDPTHRPTRAPHGPHTDPTRTPRRPHTDPTQTPHRPHTDPTQTSHRPHTDPTRTPHGPHTEPTQTPHGPTHTDLTQTSHRPHTDPTRTTHGPHTDTTRTHTDPTRTPHGPHTDPTHRPHTDPTQTPHRPHTDPTQTPHTDPTHRPHTQTPHTDPTRTPHVCHSTAVWVLGPEEPAEYDGLLTARPGVTLGAPGADCIPLLLADPVRGACGAVHSGWRGTVGDIGGVAVRAMVAELGCSARDLRVVLGPSIGPCCFQVGPEVAARFSAIDATCLRHLADGTTNGDLRRATRILLERSGVLPEHIDDGTAPGQRDADTGVVTLCTSCHPELFFSYRRDGSEFGTMLGFIALRE
ncbi:purine nucleoside phosphorylase LACC1 [Petromyzon marinus]|uniref:purine nucleoside phosphorylase LACC1 n=1 Tax=Petromyzon marinus TaxID=7757 RepID=UPI003F6EB4E3